MDHASVGSCLSALGINDPDTFFDSCSSINEEFKILKRQYLKLCLTNHPDKGGAVERFREIQSSFECLRGLFEKGKLKTSFADVASKDVGRAFDDAYAHFEGMPTPSYTIFVDAPIVRGIRVEPVKVTPKFPTYL